MIWKLDKKCKKDEDGYEKTFLFFPIKLRFDTHNTWVWLESVLVKRSLNAAGEGVNYYKRLDGSLFE